MSDISLINRMGRILILLSASIIQFFFSGCKDKKDVVFVEYQKNIVAKDTFFEATLCVDNDTLGWKEYVTIAKKYADTCTLGKKLEGVFFVNTSDLEFLHSNKSYGYPDESMVFWVVFSRNDSTHSVESACWMRMDSIPPAP